MMSGIPIPSTGRQTTPQWDIPFLFSWIKRLSLWSILGAFLLVLTMMLGARWLHFSIPIDPFSSYKTILPGAPLEKLDAFNCQRLPNPTGGPLASSSQSRCDIFPKTDPLFHLIAVEVRGDYINRVEFYSQYLQFDQLMQLWGEPQAVARGMYHKSFKLFWDRGSYTVSAVVSRPLGTTIVRLVELTGK